MQALPVEVHSLQLSPRGSGGASLYGQIENLRTEEGATVALRFHFLSPEGEEVGMSEVDVQMAALETSVPFQADLEGEAPVLAYWYEVTNEVPVIELPEEEADTTGTGNTGN